MAADVNPRDQGNFKSAGELAEQMIASDPDLAMPWLIKGLIKLDEGKKPEAVPFFQRAKALDPGDGEIDKILKSLK